MLKATNFRGLVCLAVVMCMSTGGAALSGAGLGDGAGLFGVAEAKKGKAKAGKKKLSKKEKKALKKAKKRQKKFFKKGAAAYEDEVWDDAIASFQLAYDALPKASILFNIARCYENKTELIKAIEFTERFVAGEDNEEVRQEGQDLLSVLKKKVGATYATVKITAKPKGAEVRLKRGDEDAVSGPAPFERFLEPGPWTVTIVKEGWDEWKEERALEAGKTLKLDVKLVDPKIREAEAKAAAKKKKEEAAAAKKKAAEEKAAADAAEKARAEADAAAFRNWLIIGGGAALLAAGTVTAFMLTGANSEIEELEKDGATVKEFRTAEDDAASLALMTNVLLGLGGATAITGGVLIMLTDGPPTDEALALPSGALISYGGRF